MNLRVLPPWSSPKSKEHAEEAVGQFESDFRAKYPKAVASLTEHQKELLTFYNFPAEHWEHMRAANPIESAFAPCAFGNASPRAPSPELRLYLWPTSYSTWPASVGAA